MSRSLTVVVALLTLAGCRCGSSTVSSRYGELVVVQLGATGRETLSREATVTLPPVFMSTVGTGEVKLRNVGLEEISIASVTRLDGDEALTLDDAVGLAVGAGVDASLTARFAAPQASDATLAEVTHRARFSLLLAGARAGEDEVLLEVVAVAVARDCFVPSLLDFGQVPLRQAITAPVVLENGSALAATTVPGPLAGADANAFFLDLSTSLEVPAGGRAELPVRFSPLEERAYAASFTLRRSSACPEGTVRLVGEGSDLALTWSPTQLSFGRLPLTTSVTKQVTIVSNANLPLTLGGVATGGDFAVVRAPASVPAHGRAVIDVSCTPTSLGPKTNDLTFAIGTTPPTIAHVPLSCTGGGPRIRVDPAPLQFGQVPLNLDLRRKILVQNVGTAPPAPGDPANNLVLGAAGSLPWFAIVPKNALTTAADFAVSVLGQFDNTVGLPAIAGQNFAEFEVTLRVGTVGLREADLLVYSNDATQPVVKVAITATGRLPEQCDLDITPAGADFGPTPRGAVVSRTITITNQSAISGNTCLVSGIEMAPGSNPAFLVTEPALPSLLIAQGQSKTIRITASVPGAPAEEYLRGTLRLQVGSEAALRTLPVDLQVSRCLVVDPPLLDLGVVQTGCTSASKVVSIYNVCGLPIELTGLSMPAAPFRITSSPFGGAALTLAPAQHLSVAVAAAPTSAGTFTGALTIDSIEGGTTTNQSVALRATANASGQQQEAFTQGVSEVDILLVVDNSCSMSDEQMALATNFAAFISSATQSTSSWHIGVTSTDTLVGRGALVESPNNPRYLTPATPNVASLFSQKVQLGVSGSGQEQPFQAMSLAVTAPNLTGANAGFLRTDAALAVVIVTDALEQSANSVGSYVTTLRRAKGNRPELVSVSVVGPFTAPGASCMTEGFVDDGRFASIISQTNGVRSDICTANWAADLETISRAVFGSRRSFELSGTARNSSSVVVTVDGAPVSASSWSLVNNAVVFDTPPAPGAAISIDYVTACF